MKIKPGHEHKFVEAFNLANQTANGFLGWSGHARLLVELGMDKMLGVGRGNKRIRRKKVKAMLKSVIWQGLMEHCE
jgi:hypothetical protein